MNDLNAHYRDLLGLDDAWRVDDVDLNLAGSQVTIRLEHRGGPIQCPGCSTTAPRADTAPRRTWRHLDTMQFTTEIQSRHPPLPMPKVRRQNHRGPLGWQALAVHADV